MACTRAHAWRCERCKRRRATALAARAPQSLPRTFRELSQRRPTTAPPLLPNTFLPPSYHLPTTFHDPPQASAHAGSLDMDGDGSLTLEVSATASRRLPEIICCGSRTVGCPLGAHWVPIGYAWGGGAQGAARTAKKREAAGTGGGT